MGAMSDMDTVLVPSTTSAGSDGVACGFDSGMLDKVVRLPTARERMAVVGSAQAVRSACLRPTPRRTLDYAAGIVKPQNPQRHCVRSTNRGGRGVCSAPTTRFSCWRWPSACMPNLR